jgi:hypothetical protein
MSQAVAQGCFMKNLSIMFKTGFLMTAGCPEPFFLAAIEWWGFGLDEKANDRRQVMTQAVDDGCHQHSLLSPG